LARANRRVQFGHVQEVTNSSLPWTTVELNRNQKGRSPHYSFYFHAGLQSALAISARISFTRIGSTVVSPSTRSQYVRCGAMFAS